MRRGVAVGLNAVDFAAAGNGGGRRVKRAGGAEAGDAGGLRSGSAGDVHADADGRGRHGCGRGEAEKPGAAAHGGGVDGAIGGHSHGGDFAFGHLVEDEAFAIRRNAQHQAAGIGADNQVVMRINGHGADVGFVGLEEDFAFAVGGDTVDFAVGSPVPTNRLPWLSKARAQMYLALGS